MPALDGMRVLDLTQWEAGTTSTQYLAWFGADVVKVERPGVGDPGRHTLGPGRDSRYFMSFNSNKRSVAIDLGTALGRDLFLRLVPGFDVVVENFTLGTMEKLGLGYEVLKVANPAIIYATIKGFGTNGPYSQFKCMDRVAQAVGGALSITGAADGPPMMPGPTFGDTGSGMHCAMGILAAYIQRLQTGQGQQVEIAMQETIASFMVLAIRSVGTSNRRCEYSHAIGKVRAGLRHPPDKNIAQAVQRSIDIAPTRWIEPGHCREKACDVSKILRVPRETLHRP